MKHPHLTEAEIIEVVQQPEMAGPGTEAWTHLSECDECLVAVAEMSRKLCESPDPHASLRAINVAAARWMESRKEPAWAAEALLGNLAENRLESDGVSEIKDSPLISLFLGRRQAGS
jgi:hypothetical protein